MKYDTLIVALLHLLVLWCGGIEVVVYIYCSSGGGGQVLLFLLVVIGLDFGDTVLSL